MPPLLTVQEELGLTLLNSEGLLSTWHVIVFASLMVRINLHRNKFCFTGGYIEASILLPGFNNVVGFWPAFWAMGNIGRVGYGASLDGTVSTLLLSHSDRLPLLYSHPLSSLQSPSNRVYSGRIHMIPAMLGPSPIRRLTGSLLQRL